MLIFITTHKQRNKRDHPATTKQTSKLALPTASSKLKNKQKSHNNTLQHHQQRNSSLSVNPPFTQIYKLQSSSQRNQTKYKLSRPHKHKSKTQAIKCQYTNPHQKSKLPKTKIIKTHTKPQSTNNLTTTSRPPNKIYKHINHLNKCPKIITPITT